MKSAKKKVPARAGKERVECDLCSHFACAKAKDCYGSRQKTLTRYRSDESALALARAAAEVESRFYGAATRVEEILRYAEALGVERLGVAFCIGMKEEARVFCDLMRRRFEVRSVCCKNASVPKAKFEMPHVREVKRENMCNPIGQAELLNRAETDLNVAIGLCVGHDALFFRNSDAPVTVLIAKDRVLAHNPVGALTCPYTLRRLRDEVF
jgi:uncharacterized metal-binding protein